MITNPVGNRIIYSKRTANTATDHHTRVVTGGSALPPDSTVCGLLYGYYNADPSLGERRGVSVVDSEEMEYPGTAAAGVMAGEGGAHAAILQRVGLHQTIFPKHKVSQLPAIRYLVTLSKFGGSLELHSREMLQ